MNNYSLGIIICLISAYVSLCIGITIKLYSKNLPLISAICIAPLVPINAILINLIVVIGSEYSRKYSLKTRVIKALKMTFKNYSYELGFNCHIIATSKMNFKKVFFLPTALIYIGITINKDYLEEKYTNKRNKKQNIDLYNTYINQIKYKIATI